MEPDLLRRILPWGLAEITKQVRSYAAKESQALSQSQRGGRRAGLHSSPRNFPVGPPLPQLDLPKPILYEKSELWRYPAQFEKPCIEEARWTIEEELHSALTTTQGGAKPASDPTNSRAAHPDDDSALGSTAAGHDSARRGNRSLNWSAIDWEAARRTAGARLTVISPTVEDDEVVVWNALLHGVAKDDVFPKHVVAFVCGADVKLGIMSLNDELLDHEDEGGGRPLDDSDDSDDSEGDAAGIWTTVGPTTPRQPR